MTFRLRSLPECANDGCYNAAITSRAGAVCYECRDKQLRHNAAPTTTNARANARSMTEQGPDYRRMRSQMTDDGARAWLADHRQTRGRTG